MEASKALAGAASGVPRVAAGETPSDDGATSSVLLCVGFASGGETSEEGAEADDAEGGD